MKGISIDDAAAKFRHRLMPGVAADQPVDMLEALEALDGWKIPVRGVGTCEVKMAVEDLPSHVLARTMLLRSEGRIIVGLSAHTHKALGSGGEPGWARFTVPHEFGHVKLHLEQLAELTVLPHDELALARANPSHRIFEDSEWQADRFAAAFMAPCAGLRLLQRDGRLNVDDVMMTFGMARSMATIRIENFVKAEAERRRRHGHRRGGR